ncbi:MAG: glycerophosphodiester phosphodiesterase [Bacillota bacterium]|jgi:glycerophosphoryl diester phosphodiesterase
MKIITHRGFSGRAPENTMAAFTAALEFQVDGLELDIHRSRDGELVICHDPTVDRTTNGKGYIKDLTWEELRRLDAGSWFGSCFQNERIPRLASLLELARQSDLLINIELKTELFSYPGIEEQLANLVKDFDLMEQCIVSSFNHYSLLRVTAALPKLKTGILYNAKLYQPWAYAKQLQAAALHPKYLSAAPEIVARAHQAGLMVNAWTVNEPFWIHRMVEAKIDAIITNFPDVVRDCLSEEKA